MLPVAFEGRSLVVEDPYVDARQRRPYAVHCVGNKKFGAKLTSPPDPLTHSQT
jgi:hypothetical protein